MFESSQFELIDFGNGKKLETFFGIPVLRDCPAAIPFRPSNNSNFEFDQSQTVYDKPTQQWVGSTAPENWTIQHKRVVFNLRPTPFGHLGVFCEQATNWDWIDNLPFDLTELSALNLFAYTGGSTLALASRGASVVHVDAAKSAVRWARQNAESTGLQTANIRWIVDDAIQFVEREIRRKNKYDIIVADPPAIGHGGKKMTWKFHRDFSKLMSLFGELSSHSVSTILLTCHTDGFDAGQLRALAESSLAIKSSGHRELGTLDLTSIDGRHLNCGHFFRWHR